MITDITFDTRPFKAGESRTLSFLGAEPGTVEIRCFVSRPPPPGYKPCKECGTLTGIGSGEAVWITADREVFARTGGELRIRVTDLDGDVRDLAVVVQSSEADAAPMASGAAMAG